MIGIIFWAGLTILIGCLYLYWKKLENYWKEKGFFEVKSNEIGGGLANALKKIHVTDLDLKLYNILKEKQEPLAGYWEFTQPSIFVADLEILKNIFVKDFDHFVDHQSFGKDYWSTKMLFFAEGEIWKDLRTKMSPTFTTGKIRRMFNIIENCSERLVKFLEKEMLKSPTVDFAKGYGKYTVDVISSAAFGLESGAFKEENSIFELMGEKLQFKMKSLKDIANFIILGFFPQLASLLNMAVFDLEACAFFQKTIHSAIRLRQSAAGVKRDDFLQIMLEARAGKLKAVDIESELDAFEKEGLVGGNLVKGKVDLSDDMICAQSIIFFLAGFDTTQTLLQFAAYQLAVSPDIQQRLANEVRLTYEKNENRFTYEGINQMEYMDKFISETLRMYPPVPRLNRSCTTEYKIPGTKLTIPVGTVVNIPAYAIHHDPDLFPEPSRFDPERFSKEGKAERSPFAFMPFGHGPRNCIGMRFALTEAKLAIAQLLRKFVIEPSDKTCIPMKFSNINTFNLRPEGGNWFKLKARV